jgi:hypothetical protein
MARSRVPRPLRGAALPLLRTFIIGRGMDLDEFRELAAALPLSDSRVSRLDGQPGIALTARRAAARAVALAPVGDRANQQQ